MVRWILMILGLAVTIAGVYFVFFAPGNPG
jgi:hypothetical protein